MKNRAQSKWIIKNKDGVVRGPFRTDEVLLQIRNGELTGEEWISLFPQTDWQPISSDPEFYDRLLDFLEGERVSEDPSAARESRSSDAEREEEENWQ